MKKKLEAELISIAHRVLKIHNREEIAQLQQEALNLYQKLSILRFYEENFEPAKPTISKADIEFAFENLQNDSLDMVIETIEEPTIEKNQEDLNSIIEDSFDHTSEPIIKEEISEDKMESPNEQEAELIESIIEEIHTTQYQDDNIIEEIITDSIHNVEPEIIEVTTVIDEVIEEEQIEITENVFENELDPVIEKLEPIVEVIALDVETENANTIDNETDFEKEILTEVVNNSENQENLANPLFNEEQPTLVDQFKPQQTENTLFSGNLFAEIDEDFSSKPDNSIQTSFENIFGQSYKDLEFIKAEQNEIDDEKPKTKRESKKTKQSYETESVDLFGAKTVSDLYTNTITLGLNDRIAFQVHLFNNSDQDLNRVVSQLNTMNNIDEALDFITNMVKPDYNNWKHKEEYEERFMALVEKRFS